MTRTWILRLVEARARLGLASAALVAATWGGCYIDRGLVQIDADHDGFDENDDCDDADWSVFPGAAEVCGDGLDNDCDGQPDFADTECQTQGTGGQGGNGTGGAPATGGSGGDPGGSGGDTGGSGGSGGGAGGSGGSGGDAGGSGGSGGAGGSGGDAGGSGGDAGGSGGA
jgi:hypothetical protein